MSGKGSNKTSIFCSILRCCPAKMRNLHAVLLTLLAAGCASQSVNPFSRFTPAEVERIEICYAQDIVPEEFGMETDGPLSEAAMPTCESYRIPIRQTNLISDLCAAINSEPLSPVRSDQFWPAWSLCEQVFVGRDGQVLAIVSVGSHTPTVEVIEGYRRQGAVIGGRGKRRHGFRGTATNKTYSTLLNGYLVEQVQTEWFMDFNNPGLRLRNAVLKKETRQQAH